MTSKKQNIKHVFIEKKDMDLSFEDNKTIILKVPTNFHKKFKAICSDNNIAMTQFAVKAIELLIIENPNALEILKRTIAEAPTYYRSSLVKGKNKIKDVQQIISNENIFENKEDVIGGQFRSEDDLISYPDEDDESFYEDDYDDEEEIEEDEEPDLAEQAFDTDSFDSDFLLNALSKKKELEKKEQK